MPGERYVVRVIFEERNQGIGGALLVVLDAQSNRVLKAECLVDYIKPQFRKELSMSLPWNVYLERINTAAEKQTEKGLRTTAQKLKQLIAGYDQAKVEKLIGIIKDTDLTMRKVMFDDLLLADLTTVFPKGDLVVDFVTEVLGETENEAVPAGAAEGTQEQKIEGPEQIIEVEPVIDPVGGKAAFRLAPGDVVVVNTVSSSGKVKISGPVLDLVLPNAGEEHLDDRIVVKMQISEAISGRMRISRNTMIKVENPVSEDKDEEKKSFLFPDMITIITGFIAFVAIAAVVYVVVTFFLTLV